MGESVSSIKEANEVTQEFLTIIKTINDEKLKSIVSLDLSHIGLAVDKELAFENFKLLAKTAKENNIEVVISAEGIDRTDEIIETFCRISPDFPNVGLTLQAYLAAPSVTAESPLKLIVARLYRAPAPTPITLLKKYATSPPR